MGIILPSRFDFRKVLEKIIPQNLPQFEKIQAITTASALIEPYLIGEKDEDELREELENFFKVLLNKDDVSQEVEQIMRVVKIERSVRTSFSRPVRRRYSFG